MSHAFSAFYVENYCKVVFLWEVFILKKLKHFKIFWDYIKDDKLRLIL